MGIRPLREFRYHIHALNEQIQPYYKTVFVVYVVATVLANLVSAISGRPVKMVTLYTFLAATILLITLLLWSTLSEARKKKAGRLKSPNPALKVLDDANLFRFHKDGSLTWECRMTVSACTAGVDAYNVYMSWRGPMKSIIASKTQGCVIDLPNGSGAHGTDFQLSFPHTLQKGGVHTFSFSIKLPNTNGQLSQFLRYARPYIPERSLTLSLEIEEPGPFAFKRSVQTEITGKGRRKELPEDVRMHRLDWDVEEEYMEIGNIFVIEKS